MTSRSTVHEKQLRGERETQERRTRESQSRLDELRRDQEAQLAALKADLRLSKEDAMRFQQDLEDAEHKIKEGNLHTFYCS